MSSSRGPVVAVLGNGPRALWALECLDACAQQSGASVPSAIHVFGKGDLGAGVVYDVAQPDYLRLNVTSTSVNAWRGLATRGLSFDSWRELRDPGSLCDPYPPRSLTGVYLREQATSLLHSLRHTLGNGSVVVHDRNVHVARPSADGTHRWLLDDCGPYDEVLIAVGHGHDWPGALRHYWSTRLPPLQPRVFPVSELLARPELRPGATVVVRGAALTAIDAVLALTVGRGHRPGDSDLRIVLTSRTGKLMTPKTEVGVLRALLDRAGDLTRFSDQIAKGAAVPAQLRALAVHLLGGTEEAAAAVHAAEAALFVASQDCDQVAILGNSIAVAHGERAPDGAWALGQAWRLLYADLVTRQRRTTPVGPPLDWPGYAAWAPELERLAFGPPLRNAQLLWEGLAAGRIVIRRDDVMSAAADADLVVDAVLPPPGIVDVPAEGVLGRLRDSGVLTHSAHQRGVRVADDASVLDRAGARVPGLALVGRATEDVVLGNDTLIRHLHPAVEAWARRVLSLSTHSENR